jgi:hypothetical protein
MIFSVWAEQNLVTAIYLCKKRTIKSYQMINHITVEFLAHL